MIFKDPIDDCIICQCLFTIIYFILYKQIRVNYVFLNLSSFCFVLSVRLFIEYTLFTFHLSLKNRNLDWYLYSVLRNTVDIDSIPDLSWCFSNKIRGMFFGKLHVTVILNKYYGDYSRTTNSKNGFMVWSSGPQTKDFSILWTDVLPKDFQLKIRG